MQRFRNQHLQPQSAYVPNLDQKNVSGKKNKNLVLAPTFLCMTHRSWTNLEREKILDWSSKTNVLSIAT